MVNKPRSLTEKAELIASGEVGSVELLDSTLERIEASRETLNAFRIVRPEAARAEAEAADRSVAAGERLPLLGVPIAIKDDMDLAGEPTAFGCPGEFEPKSADGAVAAKLKAAGAVIVGKTNSPEIGLWPFTEGSAFGVTRNPWNLDHSPGGSSGGAAAAVSGGLIPAAVGSDGAGSVRIPASWTNLVGVKPQRGRISTWPDAEAFKGLTVNGPLAHTVADAALLLDVLSGNVDGDLHRPPAHARNLPRGRRPAARPRCASPSPSTSPTAALPPASTPRSARAVERTATVLEGLGHEVEGADIPYGIWPGASIMPRSMAGHPRVDRSGPRPLAARPARAGERPPRPRPAAAAARRPRRRADRPADRRPDLPPLRRRPGADHGAAAAADRRLRGAEQLGDRQGRSSPPVPTPGRGTCSAGRASTCPPASPSPACRSAPSCSARPTARRRLLAVASQIEAEAPWHRHRPAAIETPMGAG